MEHLLIILKFFAFELAVVFLALFFIDYLVFRKTFLTSLRQASRFHLTSVENSHYLKAVLIGFAATSVWFDFINRHTFEHLVLWRALVDWLLLLSLLFLAFRQWIKKVNDISYWIASGFFFTCLIIKLRFWLWAIMDYSPGHWTYIIVFSLPLLIVCSDLADALHLSRKYCLITAASFFTAGIIYQYVFLNDSNLYVQEEAYDLPLMHTQNFLCFYYMVCITFMVTWIRKSNLKAL